MKLAIVVSTFNEIVTEKLLEGALTRLNELGVSNDAITVIKVPGAIEIPLTAKMLARTNKYRAIIALSAVIRGETGHYDYVCEQVSSGCQQVMMSFDLPVIFGVLTTYNADQALARVGGNKGHKGREAADAAWQMINVVSEISAN